jgi:glycerophosphoryl diester phosphodiesterase
MTMIIAHRGASRRAPENTIAAFDLALKLGADAVELDVRSSADGILVVHHDPHLVDGRVIIETRSGDLPPSVPTLDAALDACGGLVVNVEVKNVNRAAARATADLLAHRIAGGVPPDRFIVSSFDRDAIDMVRRMRPDIPTALLVVDPGDVAALANDLAADGHSALHPHHAFVTREDIDAAHRAGLRVNVWTCDDVGRLAELTEWDVDGICTNVPDAAIDVRTSVRVARRNDSTAQ